MNRPLSFSDFVAAIANPVLQEEEDPYLFYLACDDSDLPDWELANKYLRPAPGVVIVEMLPAPKQIGGILLPEVMRETRTEDEAIPGFESSVGIVLAVGDHKDPRTGLWVELAVRPGERVLVVDGDGAEFSDFASGPWEAKYKVRIYGRVVPEENDFFSLPYQGYCEEVCYDEGIVAWVDGSMIAPTGRNILVRKDPFASMSASGFLVIPDIGQERAPKGTIVAAGPDCDDGIKEGMRCVYQPETEMAFRDANDPDLRMIHELAVLTCIEPEPPTLVVLES